MIIISIWKYCIICSLFFVFCIFFLSISDHFQARKTINEKKLVLNHKGPGGGVPELSGLNTKKQHELYIELYVYKYFLDNTIFFVFFLFSKKRTFLMGPKITYYLRTCPQTRGSRFSPFFSFDPKRFQSKLKHTNTFISLQNFLK